LQELTFYKLDGKDLVRKKSSLDKKRVKSDPAFANSRKSSKVFGKAAAIAREVYRALPKEKRKHGLIGKLTGIANRLLHEGKSEFEVKELLKEEMRG
jgi:hypothetical protein